MARGAWRRVRGTSERYTPPPSVAADLRGKGLVAPDGTVSRRQYDNYRLRASSDWRSRSEYERARQTPRYQRHISEAVGTHPDLTRKDYGPTGEFGQLQASMRHATPSENRSPDGPLARYLVFLGRREPDDTWDVGDTPQGKGNATQ